MWQLLTYICPKKKLMPEVTSFSAGAYKPKSFWSRPEGVAGFLFLAAVVGGASFLIISNITFLLALAQNVLYLTLMIIAVGALVYMVADPRMRTLVWYMYKSLMRTITGAFVTIDPVGILKNYVSDLEKNLQKMRDRIGVLRGQIAKLQQVHRDNEKDIDASMKLAQAARNAGNENQMLLNSRKAARLQESNEKYAVLVQKMEVLYRILTKMHDNSEVLLDDTSDQVKLKEQERKAIRTSYSAMRSAMSIISGDPDKRAMFDMAMETIADDVAGKVGEMERFMEMSANFMDSVDLQNGVFEEQGLRMLEEWEKKSSLLLPGAQSASLGSGTSSGGSLKLPSRDSASGKSQGNSYDNLFQK